MGISRNIRVGAKVKSPAHIILDLDAPKPKQLPARSADFDKAFGVLFARSGQILIRDAIQRGHRVLICRVRVYGAPKAIRAVRDRLGGSVTRHPSSRRRQTLNWENRADMRTVLEAVLPWLIGYKKHQAEAMLDYFDARAGNMRATAESEAAFRRFKNIHDDGVFWEE